MQLLRLSRKVQLWQSHGAVSTAWSAAFWTSTKVEVQVFEKNFPQLFACEHFTDNNVVTSLMRSIISLAFYAT